MQHAERDIRAGAGSKAAAGPNRAADCLWAGTEFTRLRSAPGDLEIPANSYFRSNCPSGEDLLLAGIDFTGNSAGTSSLAVGYYTGGPGDNVLFDSTVLDASSSFFQSGSLNIVPEPHTALLFGMGLTFLGVRQRSQHSRHPDRFLGKGKRSTTPEREML